MSTNHVSQSRGGRASAPRGFVLLYAVVISTLVLAVGISIISIATKQVAISGLGRESQFAFYAANTGTECALFWDFHGFLQPIVGSVPAAYARLAVFPNPLTGVTDTEVPDAGVDGDGNPTGRSTVYCSATQVMSTDATKGAWTTGVSSCNGNGTPCTGGTCYPCNHATFTVRLDPADQASACAVVTVQKTLLSSYQVRTDIDSRGYNTCDPTSSRRVERGLRYTY